MMKRGREVIRRIGKSISQIIRDRKKRITLIGVFWAVVIIGLSGWYLSFSWLKYNAVASTKAIQLAESLQALLHAEHVSELTGKEEDLGKHGYLLTKSSLKDLVEITKSIRYAYLIAEQNGEIVLLVDSGEPDMSQTSWPGQVYADAGKEQRIVFATGETVFTEPAKDRISVLVPIKDESTGSVIAVFGIDYSLKEWRAELAKSMVPDIVIVITILILAFSMLYGWYLRSTNVNLTKQLTYDEVLYHSVFTQAPIGIAIVNDKKFVHMSDYGHSNMNPIFEQILGRTSRELESIAWPDITHPDDLPKDMELFEQFRRGETDGYSLEKRFLRPDGSYVWTSMKISRLFADRTQASHLCLLEDITARKETASALKESERRESVLLSYLPGLAYRCKYEPEGTMLFVSDGCYSLTGYKPESFIYNRDLPFKDIIAPADRERLWEEWQRTVPNKLPYQCEYAITTVSGEQKWVLEIGRGIYNERDEVEALEGIILNITDRKKIENRLRYINEHDRWTGLYNREYLEKVLTQDTRSAMPGKRALISINLSTVQLLTANYGFHYTQKLIKKASEALKQYCDESHSFFKTYENRFVFYVKDYKEKKDLLDLCDSIAGTLESVFETDRIAGGIGIIEIDRERDENVDSLLKKLLIASEKSLNIFDKDFHACFYDEALEAKVNREGDIRQELSRVAAEDDSSNLYLMFQPILDLKTDKICGFEALARLNTEKLGVVSPVEFIPIAEKTKLIVPIGEKIFYKAFAFLKKLEARGYDTVSVAVNVSAVQLLRPDFADKLHEILRETHVNPLNVAVEITESVFSSDYEKINDIIHRLRESGIQISIDDFGTGYSSLARERALNVDCLKIDKFFIDNMLKVGSQKSITADIISMAHKLGHYTVAEGVEHEEQKQYLSECGCDKIQGYYIAKPLPEETALAFLDGRK